MRLSNRLVPNTLALVTQPETLGDSDGLVTFALEVGYDGRDDVVRGLGLDVVVQGQERLGVLVRGFLVVGDDGA